MVPFKKGDFNASLRYVAASCVFRGHGAADRPEDDPKRLRSRLAFCRAVSFRLIGRLQFYDSLLLKAFGELHAQVFELFNSQRCRIGNRSLSTAPTRREVRL